MLKWSLGLATLMVASAAFAADVKMTGVHNCCGGCAMNIKSVLEKAGATNINVNKGDVSFAHEQPRMAVRALYAAGYAGKIEGGRAPGTRRAQGITGKTLKVEGVHLCCGACVKAVNDAVAKLGKTDAKAKETTFTITSENDLDAVAVLNALRAAGFNARISK